jgi:putative hydrolase of the HAD superfamily
MDAYRSIASTPIRHAIDKKKLWEAFFCLDRFSLLQWGDYHGTGEPVGRNVPMVPEPTGVRPRGTLPRPPSTVLFDFYGTLFISESGDIGNLDRRSRSAARLSHMMHRFNVQEPPDSLISRFLEAIRSEHRRARAAGIDHPEVEIDRVWMDVLAARSIKAARRFAEAFENAVNPVWPMPNLEAALRHCRTRKIRMGIVSNAQFFTLPLFDTYLDRSVEELGFDPRLVLLSYRFGRAKPSLSLYRTAARRVRETGGDAAEVLFVGNDMRNDIWPAKRMGFMTALFAGDARSLRLRKDDSACGDVEPDLVIDDLAQLLDHIGPAAGTSRGGSARREKGRTLKEPLTGQRKQKHGPQ